MDRIIISFFIIIIIVMMWTYYMEHHHPIYEEMWIDDIIAKAKTGDLILFKSTDHYNSSIIISYFTHIGVVWRPSNQPPMLFEAAGTTGMTLYDNENKAGIFCTDLETRLSRYNGMLFYKELNKSIPESIDHSFSDFITYAKTNMYYNYNVITNGIKKGLSLERCNLGTNCGEIAFLSLIKLGILSSEQYNTRVFHHLHWISNLEAASNDYCYLSLKKIRISPFGNYA